MQFYGIDYYLEQKYFVEKSAFIDAVNKSLEYIKNIKLINFEIYFNHENIFIEIKISLSKNVNFQDIIPEIQEGIEDSIYSLTDTKPTNIKIDIEGIY